MELNHTFRRQFLKALDQAFTNKDEIENLVWLTFNKSLDQIAINKETSSAIIWTVIHVAEKKSVSHNYLLKPSNCGRMMRLFGNSRSN